MTYLEQVKTRNEALEEAARVCDGLFRAYGAAKESSRPNSEARHRSDSAMYAAMNAAARIRALKTQEAG